MVDAVLLLGPTASGKSALALRLAREFPIEIVSVDSAQVYRELDIGSAKPRAAERAAVPHHLIDMREPSAPYSAAQFVTDATAAIRDIRHRGRWPLAVGGTMLYAKALRDGLAQLPSAQPELRERLAAEGRALGWPAMHERLAAVDPATAARLRGNDSQRIQRALEIIETTGAPMSAQLTAAAPTLSLFTVALMPADRAQLHRRIEARFDAMIQDGLVDEVRRLMARGDLQPSLPSMRSVGYRQAWQHLEQRTPFATFRTAGIAATRQLAKRQLTWLRSFGAELVLDPFMPEAYPRLRTAVATAFAAG